MYRRLVSGILTFTMAVQLCSGTVYAAEKTESASYKIENEESETGRDATDEAPFGSISEDTEGTAHFESEEAESTMKPEVESEVNTDAETEDTTNSGANSELETENVSKSETGIQTESETEAEVEIETETEIETEIETDTPDLQLSCENLDDSEEEAFEEGNPDFLFQAGGFQVMDTSENKISLLSEEDGISLLSEGDIDELSDILYTALKNKAASIDIRNYQFNYNSTEDRNQLLMLYYAVVNDHPDLYYVRTGYGVSYLTSSKTITKISPNYHKNIDDDAFEEGVQKAKSVIVEDMDDLQKAIAVHDYIVLNCEYDKERLANGTMPNESYSAYGVLANQIAVCQGYALAYKYLMNEYGIDCYIVTSDKMNHAWNIVKIGDALYQVDLTWDDPTWDKYGLVRHSYMFQSDEEFQKSSNDHSSHHDWYVTEGSGVVDIKAEGTIYDNAFWRDVNSPLVYDNSIDVKYYFVSKNEELQSWTYNIEGTGEADMMIKLDTPYSGLALDGSKLYYNTSKNISYIDVRDADYTEQVRYSLEENDTDQIFGFTRNDHIIRYVKRAQYHISEKSTIYALDDSQETITEAEKKSYTVTFRDSFGTIFATRNVEEGGYAVPPAVTPPDGYKFSYWEGTYSNIKKDETVTAIYTKISYAISYVLNGGINSTDNKTKYDVDTNIILADPTRDYYDFGGWYEDADFQTKVEQIEKGSTGNRIFYAKWIPKKFAISYELDGGENDARNPEEYTIETNTFELANPTKKGYEFDGWYTEPEYVTLITEVEKGSIGSYTFYAKWTLRKYMITYELDGGENSDLNPAEYTIMTDSVRLKAPTKDEYQFDGWYTDSNYKTGIAEIEKGHVEDLTLYAKWVPNPYTIVYELDGGENSSLNPTEYTIETKDFYLEAPTKKCYDFEGWYVDPGFTTVITEIEKGSTGDRTLYAKWTPTRYPIRYELDGGTNSPENPTEYNVETADIVLEAPVKEQYIFDGWYADSDYQEKIDTIKTGSSGAVILYAKWSLPKHYYVRFFDDAGNLLVEIETEEGNSVLAPRPEERTGYEFVQWDKDFTNVQDDLDIKAIYHPIQYTITYELDGAVNVSENPSTYTIETADFDFAAPVHPDMNLVFAGWYCDTDFQDEITSIVKGSTGDITIYAKWEKRRIDCGNGLFLEIKDFADRMYTGQAITFDEIAVYNDTNELRPGIDYTISYANNINAADASSNYAPAVIINGTGNYNGKCMSRFTIQPVDIGPEVSGGDIVIEEMAVSYKKGKTQKPIPVVIWKGKKLAVNKDFTVTYEGSPSNVGVYPITITGKGNFTGTAQTSLTITDNTNQIAMSTVKITKKIPAQAYSSDRIVIDEDMITLKCGSTQLIAGRDYEFDQHEYQGAGTHYVTIRGKGERYIGEITTSFDVSGTKASQFKVESVVCAGRAVKPVIKDKTGRQLTEGTDYVINSLTGSESAGTAKISVTGMNAYYGTVTKSFKVTPRSINDSEVIIQFENDKEIQPYEKNGAKPKVVVKYNERTLEEGVDYSLSYKNNNKMGAAATVTISGKKNFKEKAVRTFTVGAGSLENTSITVPDKVVSTKAGGYVSVPVLKDANGKKLTAGKDYDKNIMYQLDGRELNKKADRVLAGAEITVEVIGRGNYAGSRVSAVYRIITADKNLSKAKVTVNSRKYYTGSEVVLNQEDLTVKVGGVTLSTDDYEIVANSYINNRKKGTAKVTIHGIGKYGGTKTISFKIYAKKLE